MLTNVSVKIRAVSEDPPLLALVFALASVSCAISSRSSCFGKQIDV